MKKLLLAALLLSSVTFAQEMMDLKPQCKDNKVTFMHEIHMITDFCIHGLKITDIKECVAQMDDLESYGVLRSDFKIYAKARHKEICGK